MSNADVLKRANITPVDELIGPARLRWLGHDGQNGRGESTQLSSALDPYAW